MKVTYWSNGTGPLQVVALTQDSSPSLLQGYALNFELNLCLPPRVLIANHKTDEIRTYCITLVGIGHPSFPSQQTIT